MSYVYDALATIGLIVCVVWAALLCLTIAMHIRASATSRRCVERRYPVAPSTYTDPEAERAATEANYVHVSDFARQREGRRG